MLQLKDDGDDVELASWLTRDEGSHDTDGATMIAGLLSLLLPLGLCLAILGAAVTAILSYCKRGSLRADTFSTDAQDVLRSIRQRGRASCALVMEQAVRVPIVAQGVAAFGVASRVAKSRTAALMDATPLRHVASEWYQAVLPNDVETADMDEDDEASAAVGREPWRRHAQPFHATDATLSGCAASCTSQAEPTMPRRSAASASEGMVEVSLGSPEREIGSPRHMELGEVVTPGSACVAACGANVAQSSTAAMGVEGMDGGAGTTAQILSRFWGAANSLGAVFRSADDDAAATDDCGGVAGGNTPRGSEREGAVLQTVSFETIEGACVETTIGVVVGDDTYPHIERRLQQLGAQILPRSMLGAHADGHGALFLSTQYYDAESKGIVEADAESVIADMLKAASWRVLVLGQ